MKKSIYLSLFLFLTFLTETSAQSLNFGLKGGANFSNFQGSNANLKSESITNYHGGVFLELRLSQSVSIQPEALYSTAGAKVSLSGAVDEFRNKLGYISIPLLAKFYLIPDMLSIDLGPQFSFLLSEKGNVNLGNTSSYDFSVSGGITLHILGPIFIQGRYNFGLNEIRPNTNVSNRVLQLSAGLRF